MSHYTTVVSRNCWSLSFRQDNRIYRITFPWRGFWCASSLLQVGAGLRNALRQQSALDGATLILSILSKIIRAPATMTCHIGGYWNARPVERGSDAGGECSGTSSNRLQEGEAPAEPGIGGLPRLGGSLALLRLHVFGYELASDATQQRLHLNAENALEQLFLHAIALHAPDVFPVRRGVLITEPLVQRDGLRQFPARLQLDA